MSCAPAGPLDAAAVLAWMQAHPDRLRELLAEEDALDADTQAAADSAVRAHLRFAAEALPVGLRSDLAARVEGMTDDLDAWFEADREVLERDGKWTDELERMRRPVREVRPQSGPGLRLVS